MSVLSAPRMPRQLGVIARSTDQLSRGPMTRVTRQAQACDSAITGRASRYEATHARDDVRPRWRGARHDELALVRARGIGRERVAIAGGRAGRQVGRGAVERFVGDD